MAGSEWQGGEAAPGDEPARKIKLLGREFHLPRSRWLRVTIGIGLMVFGIFGFLPVLGFWMIPLGLLVLSYEFHVVRRQRRRLVVWRERRRKNNANNSARPPGDGR